MSVMTQSSLITRSRGTPVTTIVWVLALPMVLGFYALSNIENEVEFKTLNTFFILYLSSGFGILLAQVNLRNFKIGLVPWGV